MSAITTSAIFCGVCMFFGWFVVESIRFVKEFNDENFNG